MDTSAKILIALATVLTTSTILLSRRSPCNIAGPPSASFVTGNLTEYFAPEAAQFWLSIAERYGGILKINALFGTYFLSVKDPKALYHILVKDHDIFEPSDSFLSVNSVLFGKGLLATQGDVHKKQRKMLNPVFSAKHLRGMTPTFYTVARELKDAILVQTAGEPRELEMVGWLTRVALELIGRSGLGHSFEDFANNKSSKYASAAKDLTPTLFGIMSWAGALAPFVIGIGSASFRRWAVGVVPSPALKRLQDITDIMWETSVELLELKKKQALENSGESQEGADLINLLLKANDSSRDEDKLSNEELLGQMSTFIFAAMDTTSGALARMLHLLALSPEVQCKLRAEIVEATLRSGGDLNYDELSDLPYLDAVCRETLRVYPPSSSQFKQPNRDCVLPLAFPIVGVDGKECHEVPIKKGDTIIVSILTANHAKEVWGDDADEWKPERWLSPLPESVTGGNKFPGIYSHMMTFLGGGRACIGFKFSQLELKVVLAVLLQSLEFSLLEGKKIEWRMSIFMTPFVEGSKSTHGELPLLVRAL